MYHGPLRFARRGLMERLFAMFDLCQTSSGYIRLPQNRAAADALLDRLKSSLPKQFLDLEELVNAHAVTATREGFVNGYMWAHRTHGLHIQISQELLSATIEAMRDLQARYEAEAAALASLGEAGRELAGERLESAKVARGLFDYFAGL